MLLFQSRIITRMARMRRGQWREGKVTAATGGEDAVFVVASHFCLSLQES